MSEDKKEKASISVAAKNASIAAANRELFARRGLFAVNLIGSPGCGKTALLEHTARRFGARAAVIEGDVRTSLDAERVRSAGMQAVQIETGGACHLDARQVARALEELDLDTAEMLFIENVGNLVCPSSVDLGENAKVAVVSVPEGDEKPAKYPALFVRADAVVINKTDLLPYVEYSLERAIGDCRKLNNNVEVISLSCKTGKGIDDWFEYLERKSSERIRH